MRVVCPLPDELVAVTVKTVEAIELVGVPEITQVVLFIVKPETSAGEMVQLVMAALLVFKVEGVTDIADPTVPLVPVDKA